jgi:hypothetical protein
METLILWICLILTGAALVLALRRDVPFLRNPVRRTAATIVRHDRSRERGTTFYTPVFRFFDERGRPVEVRDQLFSPFPKPVIGEQVQIVHPEGFPEKARIPYPVFRALLYALLGYAFAALVLEVTGLG